MQQQHDTRSDAHVVPHLANKFLLLETEGGQPEQWSSCVRDVLQARKGQPMSVVEPLASVGVIPVHT
jgi:hypothetical protein